jgi:hypothetical protein
MEKDAVLYGGTDPGRVVPTYMIFCESRVKPQDRYQCKNLPGNGSTFDRSDVYIITQNALADNTYMSYIRDHYDLSRPTMTNRTTIAGYSPWRQFVFAKGWTWLDRAHNYPKEPIRIPSPENCSEAFQQFVADWKAGKAPPGADIIVTSDPTCIADSVAFIAAPHAELSAAPRTPNIGRSSVGHRTVGHLSVGHREDANRLHRINTAGSANHGFFVGGVTLMTRSSPGSASSHSPCPAYEESIVCCAMEARRRNTSAVTVTGSATKNGTRRRLKRSRRNAPRRRSITSAAKNPDKVKNTGMRTAWSTAAMTANPLHVEWACTGNQGPMSGTKA